MICEQYSKLESENERLKSELGELTYHYENCKMNLESEKSTTEELRNENAKLKCLALHLFERVAFHEFDEWNEILDELSETSKEKRRAKKHRDRWFRIHERCNEKYLALKQELKERFK